MKILVLLVGILISAQSAYGAEEFGIEEGFNKPIDVPMAVASDIESDMKAAGRTCFAEGGTTAQEALEATPVILGGAKPVLLIKPKLTSEPKAAWGCYCGAYACPMWIFSFENGVAHKLWSSGGGSVKILDRKSRGFKRLLLSSGSAGHQEAELYGWNGHEYVILGTKSVVFGQGEEVDERAQEEMNQFLDEAVR